MKITINPSLDIETLRWVANDGVFEYFGPLILFGGPSAEAKANVLAQIDDYLELVQPQYEEQEPDWDDQDEDEDE